MHDKLSDERSIHSEDELIEAEIKRLVGEINARLDNFCKSFASFRNELKDFEEELTDRIDGFDRNLSAYQAGLSVRPRSYGRIREYDLFAVRTGVGHDGMPEYHNDSDWYRKI